MVTTPFPLAELIGARVAQERRARQLTLDQLAESSSISRRMLVNIEQGAANPSIGTLLKLAEALRIGLSKLVESQDEDETRLVRGGTRAPLWTTEAGGAAFLIGSTPPPGTVELWHWTLGPGDRHSSEAHPPATQEVLHVLDGEVHVQVGDRLVELDAGDGLSFRGDLPHAYINGGDTSARFSLAVLVPAVQGGPGRVTHE